MKKVLLGLMVTFGLIVSGSTFAATTCDLPYTAKQTQTTHTVSALLTNNGAQFDNMLVGQPMLIEESKKIRADLIKNITDSLTCGSDNYNKFYDYTDFISQVKYFVTQFLELKHAHAVFSNLKPITTMDSNILMLQKHLMSMISETLPQDKPFSDISSGSIVISANIPGMGQGDLNISLMSDGKFDMMAQKFDTNIKIGGMMSFKAFMDATQTRGSFLGDIDLKQADKLYVKINDIKINASGDADTAVEVQKIQTMLDGLKAKVADKYIDIMGLTAMQSDMGEMAQMPFNPMTTNTVQLISDLQNKPMITFYTQEGNNYYGAFNRNVCALIPQMQQDCMRNIGEGIVESNGKGYLVMMQDGQGYSLGLSDNYTVEKMPAEMAHLNNKPLITWDMQKISKVTVPFDASGVNGLFYSNPNLTVKYIDSDINLMIAGTMQSKNIMLNGTLNGSGWNGDMSVKYQNMDNRSLTDVQINGYMGGQKVGSFKLLSEETISLLPSLSFAQSFPILSNDEFKKIMESMQQ